MIVSNFSDRLLKVGGLAVVDVVIEDMSAWMPMFFRN
jgi:hypothetical protein